MKLGSLMPLLNGLRQGPEAKAILRGVCGLELEPDTELQPTHQKFLLVANRLCMVRQMYGIPPEALLMALPVLFNDLIGSRENVKVELVDGRVLQWWTTDVAEDAAIQDVGPNGGYDLANFDKNYDYALGLTPGIETLTIMTGPMLQAVEQAINRSKHAPTA